MLRTHTHTLIYVHYVVAYFIACSSQTSRKLAPPVKCKAKCCVIIVWSTNIRILSWKFELRNWVNAAGIRENCYKKTIAASSGVNTLTSLTEVPCPFPESDPLINPLSKTSPSQSLFLGNLTYELRPWLSTQTKTSGRFMSQAIPKSKSNPQNTLYL